MDPNTKLTIDELKAVRGSVVDPQSSLPSRIDAVENTTGKQFGNLETATKVFNEWGSRIDAKMDKLHGEVGALRKTMNRVVLDSSATTSAGILPTPEATTALTSASNSVVGPYGNHVESSHRGFDLPTQPPVTGTYGHHVKGSKWLEGGGE